MYYIIITSINIKSCIQNSFLSKCFSSFISTFFNFFRKYLWWKVDRIGCHSLSLLQKGKGKKTSDKRGWKIKMSRIKAKNDHKTPIQNGVFTEESAELNLKSLKNVWRGEKSGIESSVRSELLRLYELGIARTFVVGLLSGRIRRTQHICFRHKFLRLMRQQFDER